jgi:DNA-binding NarL/FixJ family response regulator
VIAVEPDVICVFILAENRLLREALSRLLGKKSDIRVVGTCAFSPGVVEQVVKAAPDVLVADASAMALPDLELLPEVRSAVPGIRVVMMGMEANRSVFLQAVRDGVTGYILQDASAVELAAAVRCVALGQPVCPPDLCLALFEFVATEQARSQSYSFRLKHDLGLTRREQQLIQLIDRGLTNKEIAGQLNLSEQTIKNHVHRMLRKLGATDRLSAVELCRQTRIVA